MIIPKLFQKVTLWLGISFSFFWSTLFSGLPVLQTLELKIQDFLMGTVPAPPLPPDILVVKIYEQDLRRWGLLEEQIFYANLIDHLLEAGATVVILNLRSNWIQTADHTNNPIKELIVSHPDQLVLVIPTTSVSLPNPTKWRPYNYFIPLDSEEQPLFPMDRTFGFSEYEPEEHNPSYLISPSRRAYLVGNFIFSNNFQQRQKLDAAVWLGLKKFQNKQAFSSLPIKDINEKKPIQIHFYPQNITFPSLDVQAIIQRNSSVKQVENKIVLVGFGDLNDPNTFSIHSPYGYEISNVDFQANFLANLLTHSFYYMAPDWLSKIIVIIGGIAISEIIVTIMLKSEVHSTKRVLIAVSILGILCFFHCMAFWQRLILPVTFPLLTFGATSISIIFSLLLGLRENLIEQQKRELERLKSVEQEAIISQARRLINRIYANIHDGPLQEIKIIMDSLEILQIKHPNLEINPLLEKVENIGYHLRQQLHSSRKLTLEITPELREGLAIGIKKKLEMLVISKQLTLKVKTQLQSLKEPMFNSLWISSREEIFIFFCEAITNVIQHAQPPMGSATYVKVSLLQKRSYCTLSIENNGSILNEFILANDSQKKQKGGYGTKLMENIASELPNGSMRQIILKEGGLKVILNWSIV